MMGRSEYDPMSTGGLGDTEVRGAYKVNEVLTASLGLSLPTGSVEETVTSMRKTFRAPYDMQLGSGTFDLKPALTYNALSGDALWNWGAQAMSTQAWSPMPDADPDNYGGSRIDGAVGASFVVGPVSLGVEFGIPLSQDLNGLQMKTDWFATAGLQLMF
jgi:hypothetical protein